MTRTFARTLPASPPLTGASPLSLGLLAALSLLLAAPVFAQPAAPNAEARERISRQVDDTLFRLDLNEEQRYAVAPILEADMLERLAVLQEYGIDPQNPSANGRPSMRALRKMRGDIEDVRDRTESQLRDHLTDDQLDAWKEIEEERQAEMRARFRN
ncbi:MAG: hypothetical protein AAF089_03245 [Bacteroidota bacterium]